MNRYYAAACSSVLLLSSSALADVTLSMPSNSELVLVNGIETSGHETLKLDNGTNQIAFRYQGRYQQQGSQTQFQSDVIIIKFDETNAELSLTLPRIRSNSAADKFNQSPQISLEDANKQVINFEQGKLIKDGLQLGRDYKTEMAAYNLTQQSASLKLQAPPEATVQAVTPAIIAAQASSPTTATATATAAQPNNQINVGQMLDFWYRQADEATRKAFKKRIENQ
ncbi:DUF2057 domain-containing protein [Shewanella sp. 30m-9]